jgi:hypothetical protein
MKIHSLAWTNTIISKSIFDYAFIWGLLLHTALGRTCSLVNCSTSSVMPGKYPERIFRKKKTESSQMCSHRNVQPRESYTRSQLHWPSIENQGRVHQLECIGPY